MDEDRRVLKLYHFLGDGPIWFMDAERDLSRVMPEASLAPETWDALGRPEFIAVTVEPADPVGGVTPDTDAHEARDVHTERNRLEGTADAPTEPASDLEVRPDAPSSAVPAGEARDRLAALRDDLRAVALAPGNHWTHCPVRDGGQCSCEGTLREVNDRAKARWEMADAALAGYVAQAERIKALEDDLTYWHTMATRLEYEAHKAEARADAAEARLAGTWTCPDCEGEFTALAALTGGDDT